MILTRIAISTLMLIVSARANPSIRGRRASTDEEFSDLASTRHDSDPAEADVGSPVGENQQQEQGRNSGRTISSRSHGNIRSSGGIPTITSRTHHGGQRSSSGSTITTTSISSRASASGRSDGAKPMVSSRGATSTEDQKAANESESERDLQEARIVGGNQAQYGEYPFFIQWYDNTWGTCGGALIHEDIMLTAAHCNFASNEVYVGAYQWRNDNWGITERRSITNRRRHPQYNGNTLKFDFEVMKLNRAVTHIEPIPLNPSYSVPANGEYVTVVGMGDTRNGSGGGSEFLREVAVPKVSRNQCNSWISGVDDSVMFCAGEEEGGKDSCQQDSGGPIFSTRTGSPVLVGVVSWGYGCAVRRSPGVYARVSAEYDWIQRQICVLSDNPPVRCGGGATPNPTPAPTPSTPAPTPAPTPSTPAPTPAPTPSTPAPTPAPTPATPQPTPAPIPVPVAPPPASCGSGEVELMVEISTDQYGYETSFTVNDGSGSVLSGSGFANNVTEQMTTCVANDGCFTLQVADSYGDGMCCVYGNGGYKAFFDGAEVASGGAFGLSEQTTFGDCSMVQLTIELTTDDYGGETSFFVSESNSETNEQNIILKRDPGTLNDNTDFIFETVIDPNLCYEIEINDTWGDGICCNEGDGIMVAKTSGVQVARFRNFGYSRRKSFGNC